ncbi:MAG: DEAD/DEAH box helicase [Ruminococcus sp.]|nr:DEAD/DEAH box helicase [Ruminococcus sp.]
MQFNQLNLSDEVLQAVELLGFEEMTEIQEKSIPLLLEGKDVIGHSNTGTGKTAAFGIPAVESIAPDEPRTVKVLVLCPTRELAMQACDEIKKFAKMKKSVKACAVYGGASMEKQIFELKKGTNIVVGTPGRVMDHIRRRTLKLADLRTVILDEADEMLNMGFREDIETILESVPEERQTVLFSATMPPEILAITEKFQNNPVHIKIASAQKTVDLIEQFYFEVAMGRKTDALKLLLSAYSPKSAMVFCNTKKMVDELTEALTSSGFHACGLHGDMKQLQRTQVMNSFKNGTTAVLIATDVAARGIDVSGVDAVFNYDIPQDNEYYIHRIGRTGRAGRTGVAYTLITGRKQLFELKNISRYIKAEINELPLPTKADIASLKKESLIREVLESQERPDGADFDVVSRLEDMGISLKELSAMLIHEKLSAQLAQLPEFDIPRPLSKGRRSGAKTVKIDISIGRNKRIAPNFILGALVDATGMSGKDFGKIDIFDSHTTVEVPESESEYIIDMADSIKINGTKVEVKLCKGSGSSYEKSKPSFEKGKASYNDRRRRFGGSGKSESRKGKDFAPDRRRRTKKRH